MRKYVEVGIACLISVLATLTYVEKTKPQGGFDSGFGCSTESIANMYADYINDWKEEVSQAFDEAEVKVFNVKPKPDIVGPHEDPDKCVCKGTGVIVQGDGHKTLCPYHGNKYQGIKKKLKDEVIFKQLLVFEK